MYEPSDPFPPLRMDCDRPLIWAARGNLRIGISGTLRFRITSDGCKDGISQRGLGGKCLHGTTERFCHGRKRTNRMPPKEIHL